MNRELCKLKRELIKINTPSKEKQVAKALRVIFGDTTEIPEEEAFNILGWDYKSREDMFNIADKDKINVGIFDNAPSTVINFDENIKLPGSDDLIALNVVGVSPGDVLEEEKTIMK